MEGLALRSVDERAATPRRRRFGAIASRPASHATALGLWILCRSICLLAAIQAPFAAGNDTPAATAGNGERMIAPGVWFYEKTAYGLTTAADARKAWSAMEKALQKKRAFSSDMQATIFVHHYSVEGFAEDTAHWVVLLSGDSAVKDEAKEIVALFDYQSLALARMSTHRPSAAKPIDAQTAAREMNGRQRTARDESMVSAEEVDRVSDYYLFFREASDFGATVAVSATTGTLAFHATTVAHGKGKLVVPK